MQSDEQSYETMELMARHHRVIAIAVALVLLAFGGVGAARTGHAELALGGALAALGAYFFLRLLGEMVIVISDTLLPK